MRTLMIDEPAPHVRRFTLNRPERMNALDGPTLQALNDAVREAAFAGSDTRVIVIRGSGRAFCAGNDLKWLASGVLADRAACQRHQDLMQDSFERLEAAPQIVLASVNGYALAALAAPAQALEAETLALAESIAAADGHALAAMKAMARRALELPLRDGLAYERWMQHRYRTQSPALEAGVHGFAQGSR